MAFRIKTSQDEPEDELDEVQAEAQPQPQFNSGPKPSAPPLPGARPRPTALPQQAARPAVPRELLSARPAMTKVVPRSPDNMQSASQATLQPPAELTPEEQANRQERIDYLKGLRGAEGSKPKRSRKWLIIAVALLLLILAGLAAAYWKLNKKPATKAETNTQSQQTQTTQTPATTTPTEEMKDYTSTNFALGLSYPSSWVLNDAADALTIISPSMNLPGSNGQEVAGAVVVTIRHKQTSLAEFKAGPAAAVLDSKNVNYTEPAAGQRGTTYLSFIQYASTTVKGALDSVYITGNSGYKKAQAIPEADVVKSDPLVNVHFVQCAAGATCSPTGTSTGVSGASWEASDAYKTVETILKSLSLN